MQIDVIKDLIWSHVNIRTARKGAEHVRFDAGEEAELCKTKNEENAIKFALKVWNWPS